MSSDAATPQRVRVFLASPGDVSDERALAFEVLKRLPDADELRGRISLEAVAWDKPGARQPMLATLTPQEAIRRGLPKPSECDIVVVIFWARIGTPLPREWQKPDGTRYVSGTEWEYLDAFTAATKSARPFILVYRRDGAHNIDSRAQNAFKEARQSRLVDQFFKALQNPDGSPRGGYSSYKSPSEFEKVLEEDLRTILLRLLDSPDWLAAAESTRASVEARLWRGSPFPGLRSFKAEEAAIFFGRGPDTDGLVERLGDRAQRFLAVVGASGSGKSSLCSAGLRPRLQANAIPGSKDWLWLDFKPADVNDDPMAALASAIARTNPKQDLRPRDLSETLHSDPGAVDSVARAALGGKKRWAELVLFIDQFEELFTQCAPSYREPFLQVLRAATETERVRVVATLRSDFYARCVEYGVLAELLRDGSFPVSLPGLAALREMIVRPAQRAGLILEDGLADRILEDMGQADAGALTVLGFALSRLYDVRESSGRLTHAAYERLGGVSGAIMNQAEEVFSTVGAEAQASLSRVFRELVKVDEGDVVTRQRAPRSRVVTTDADARLVDALTDGRLLVQDSGKVGEPVVEVTHEALLTRWPRLADWIAATAHDLRLLQQLRVAAAEWERNERADEFLWPDKRLASFYAALDQLEPVLTTSERRFARLVDVDEMLAELEEIDTTHQRRAAIGDRIATYGDGRAGVGVDADGLPEIAWCEVPGGSVTLEEGAGKFSVEPFEISKYPITWRQHRAFNDTAVQYRALDNHPADTVSWDEAAAFCGWLSEKRGYQIRLPTEWEWQLAATGGDSARIYPWGSEWDPRHANTEESELGRTTAVGMYPAGMSPVGALDLIGNVWEWCLNEYENAQAVDLSSRAPRVERGGAFSYNRTPATSTHRERDMPDYRNRDHGFRVIRLLSG